MTVHKAKAQPKPSDGLRQRLFAMAEPLDQITLKRAELARHFIPASREMLVAAARAQGRKGPAKAPSMEKITRTVEELSRMGDTVAQRAMALATQAEVPDIGAMLANGGFLIDHGITIVPRPGGMGVKFGHAAYGILFDKCRTGQRAVNIGAMLDNDVRVSWEAATLGVGLTLDTHFLLMESIENVEAFRTRKCDFGEMNCFTTEGTRVGAMAARISPDDMRRYVRTDAPDPRFLTRLISAGGDSAFESMLEVLHYHFNYMTAKGAHADDETEHVVASLNSMIQDELVRACATQSGLLGYDFMVSMAFGDTYRGLYQLGTQALAELAFGDEGEAEKTRRQFASLGNLLMGMSNQSPLSSLFWMCMVSDEVVREKARNIFISTTRGEPTLPESLVAELDSIRGKAFVTRENLPRILEVYRLREEASEQRRQPPDADTAESPNADKRGN